MRNRYLHIQLFVMLVGFCPCLRADDEVKPVQAGEPNPTYQPVQLFENKVNQPRPDMGGMGMMGSGGMGGGMGGGPGYFGQYQPLAPVEGQGTSLGFVRQQLNFGAPIYKDEVNTVLLNGSVQNYLFQGSAVFPDSGTAFPDTLWNLRFGPMYMRKFDDGWMLGVMAGVNMASDKPFANGRDVTANVLAFLRVPSNDNNAWLFSVFYSPFGEIPFPIPGIAYQWRPNDEWNINIGIPFSVHYQPTCDLSFDFNWMPVRNFNVQGNYRLTDALSLFSRFRWSNESWFLADRVEDRDRLFYYEMSVVGGVRYQLMEKLFAEVSGGYAFDRFFFIGQQFSDQNQNRIGLGAGLVINAGLSLRF